MAHTEYPRHLHKAGGIYTIVGDDDAKAAALADGWALAPVLDPPIEDAADAPADVPEKKKPGRKPKAVDPGA